MEYAKKNHVMISKALIVEIFIQIYQLNAFPGEKDVLKLIKNVMNCLMINAITTRKQMIM
jgi:hypothetical protein